MDISKEERKKYKAMFKAFDSNGDGTLTHVDFRIALDKIGYCLTDDDLENFISEADVDKSGKITFDEFVAAMHKPTPKQQNMAKLKRLFRDLDADKSGYITVKDLKLLSKKSGQEMTKEEMETFIRKMDKNGDKKVSFEEFAKQMTT